MYDNSMGIVLNVDNLDRDTGENKYKRRPLLEWFARFLRYINFPKLFIMLLLIKKKYIQDLVKYPTSFE